MPATTFEVYVAIDADKLRGGTLGDHVAVRHERREILASFEASLDHWIAEQRLELRHAD